LRFWGAREHRRLVVVTLAKELIVHPNTHIRSTISSKDEEYATVDSRNVSWIVREGWAETEY
jgi:hypothetical protein